MIQEKPISGSPNNDWPVGDVFEECDCCGVSFLTKGHPICYVCSTKAKLEYRSRPRIQFALLIIVIFCVMLTLTALLIAVKSLFFTEV